MDNLSYLFAAFATAWALILAYLYRLFREQQKLETELDILKQHLERELE